MFDQAYDSPCKKDPLSPEAVQHALDDKTGEGFAVLAEHFMPALKAMVSSLSVPEAEKEDLIRFSIFIGHLVKDEWKTAFHPMIRRPLG